MVFGSLETDFFPVKSLTGYWGGLAFGLVTSFFRIKGAFFAFSRKRQNGSAPNFFRI